MTKTAYLKSQQGRQYLQTEYEANRRSTHAIAADQGCHHDLVRRALVHHGIPLRNKAEAQVLALKEGRSGHPTAGRERTSEEKTRIQLGVMDWWKDLSPRHRERMRQHGRERWANMTRTEKARWLEQVGRGFRRAAVEGSRLERFLAASLLTMGYQVRRREVLGVEGGTVRVDLYLPVLKVAVDVDGPTRHLPVFGQELLDDAKAADAQKVKKLVASGCVSIRITCLASSVGERHKRAALALLSEELKAVWAEYPPPEKRARELTVE